MVLRNESCTGLVEPSPLFVKKYGSDWNLIFRISAKREIANTEIRGTTPFRKDKDVEFTIFLPFDALQSAKDVHRAALLELLRAACEVFERLAINTASIRESVPTLVETICSDPLMFEASNSAT